MNKILNGIIKTLEKNNNQWMSPAEILSKIDKAILSPSKSEKQAKAEIGARVSENRGLFEIDTTQRPQKIRLKGDKTLDEQNKTEKLNEDADNNGFSFNFEEDLKRHIVVNLEKIEDGLTLYPDGIEFNTDVGRIDILATDKNNDFVVIELKAGCAQDQVLGQILGYIAWVKRNLAKKNQNVRGIVIANNATDRVKYAVSSQSSDLEIRKYEVNFSFHSMSI